MNVSQIFVTRSRINGKKNSVTALWKDFAKSDAIGRSDFDVNSRDTLLLVPTSVIFESLIRNCQMLLYCMLFSKETCNTF